MFRWMFLGACFLSLSVMADVTDSDWVTQLPVDTVLVLKCGVNIKPDDSETKMGNLDSGMSAWLETDRSPHDRLLPAGTRLIFRSAQSVDYSTTALSVVTAGGTELGIKIWKRGEITGPTIGQLKPLFRVEMPPVEIIKLRD